MIKNKKAVSTMVSYVLLIVIALGMAAGVYAWLRFQATIPSEEELCPADTALMVKNYNCDNKSIITIIIENKGFFNINGFFIRASKDKESLPTIALTRIDVENPNPGRYDFEPSVLEPGDSKTLRFHYLDTLLDSGTGPKRIQIQPFIYSKDINDDEKIRLCENTIDFDVDESKSCN